MFPIKRTYAEFGLGVAMLRGDLQLARSCYLSIKDNWHWLDWNLPIIAASTLSFVPELDNHWSYISGVTQAKKSRSAYALANLLLLGFKDSIVVDFGDYIERTTTSNGLLFRYIKDKPVSAFLKTLAFAVDYLDPTVRFRYLGSTIDTKGATVLPWWAYPVSSPESREIQAFVFSRLSNELFDYEFNTLFRLIVNEGYPIDNHVDYDGIYKIYIGDMPEIASRYYDQIDSLATQVANILEQVKQGEHGDWFGMVGEE
jgi:hypothetical protein